MSLKRVAVAVVGTAVIAAGTAGTGTAATSTSAVRIGSAVSRDCTTKFAGNARGVAVRTFTAQREGLLRARLSGADTSDFDLGLFDAATRRPIQGSAAFGSNELAEAYTLKGTRVLVQVCRRTGRDRSARLSLGFRSLDVAPVKPN